MSKPRADKDVFHSKEETMRRQRDKPAFSWKDVPNLLNSIKHGCRLTGHALRS